MKIFAPAKTFYFPIDQFVYTPRIVHKRPELKGHKFAAETAVRCSKVILERQGVRTSKITLSKGRSNHFVKIIKNNTHGSSKHQISH